MECDRGCLISWYTNTFLILAFLVYQGLQQHVCAHTMYVYKRLCGLMVLHGQVYIWVDWNQRFYTGLWFICSCSSIICTTDLHSHWGWCCQHCLGDKYWELWVWLHCDCGGLLLVLELVRVHVSYWWVLFSDLCMVTHFGKPHHVAVVSLYFW